MPPKWLLVEDSNDLFCLWWENHHYQEIQDQNIAVLSTSLDSLVREKVALEEHICVLELCEGVMRGLVDSLVKMGEAQSNHLDFLQYLANNFIRTVMEWDTGGGRGNVPSESAGSLGPGYVPSSSSRSSPPSLRSLSLSLTRWSELVSPITPISESGRTVAIEEAEFSGHSFRTTLLAIPNSEVAELSDLGLPGDGGSDGGLGGDLLNITNPTAAQSDKQEHEWREDNGPSEVQVELVVRQQMGQRRCICGRQVET